MAKKQQATQAENNNVQRIEVRRPNEQRMHAEIVGIAPYVQLAFGAKARHGMEVLMTTPDKEKKKSRKREPRNFDDDFKNALHVSGDGWYGIPASAFRNAMISCCRTAGIVMTRAKLAIFVEPDGFDAEDGQPLVKIEGSPKQVRHYVRNANASTDLRVRGMWDPGWRAKLVLRFDADVFTPSDVANLLLRSGTFVGIGEGRPDSRKSAGMGWGLFTLAEDQEVK